jgi:hypothetical protein
LAALEGGVAALAFASVWRQPPRFFKPCPRATM